jgi:putative thymidine phosphorylase
MKLLVKDLKISTGGVLVAVLHSDDASILDLNSSDRILIKTKGKEFITAIDVTDDSSFVKPGHVGLMDELFQKLKLNSNSEVNVKIAPKPDSLKFIKKKLDGKSLNYDEMKCILEDVVAGNITQVELTYYVAANYMKGMSLSEVVDLTNAMINTGDKLVFKNKIVFDKHCIGGVAGNRTTMVVVPMLIAAGLTVPKTSSRAITSPAGTSDTVEVLARVDLPVEKIKKVVAETGGCMVWGGAVNLAPADDTIINVEHPLSIDAEGQLLASILAKKGSVSSNHVVIDIPVGKSAKIDSMKEAIHLKKMFEKIGKKLGMKMLVLITDGSEPVGNGIGPALEARDVLWLLKNDIRAPYDLFSKAVFITGKVLEMAGKCNKGSGFTMARDLIKSGKAYRAFMKMLRKQGLKIKNVEEIKFGRYTSDVLSSSDGCVGHISNKVISKICRLAGCPREKESGVYLFKHKGDHVVRREPLFRIFSNSKQKLKFAVEYAKQNMVEII